MTTWVMLLVGFALICGASAGDTFSSDDDDGGEWERSEMNKEGMNYKE
ncbi:MAG: hypothetical protein K2X55_13055 [Burkholderiaceae bacterium]|nr:hypothetical protein [Burkholderiaceae bacterium]